MARKHFTDINAADCAATEQFFLGLAARAARGEAIGGGAFIITPRKQVETGNCGYAMRNEALAHYGATRLVAGIFWGE